MPVADPGHAWGVNLARPTDVSHVLEWVRINRDRLGHIGRDRNICLDSTREFSHDFSF